MSSAVLSPTNASLCLTVFPFFAQRRPQVCKLNSIRDKLKKCAGVRHIYSFPAKAIFQEQILHFFFSFVFFQLTATSFFPSVFFSVFLSWPFHLLSTQRPLVSRTQTRDAGPGEGPGRE